MITDTVSQFLDKLLSGLNDKNVDVTEMEMDHIGYQPAKVHLEPILEIISNICD